MFRRNLYTAVFTGLSVIVLAIGGFGQGKGHGGDHGGGNPHGGGGGGNPHGGGNGGGQPQQQRQYQPPQQQRGGGGNPHGNGNGGGQQRQVWAQQMQQRPVQQQQQRASQQQQWQQQRAIQQQQRAAQQQQWQQQRAIQQQQRQPQQRVFQQPQQQRQNDRGGWMQQRAAQQQQWQQQRAIQQQQRQNDRGSWVQQRQNNPDLRRQQQVNPREWRQNQQALRQQFQQNYVPPQQPAFNNGHDNGRHNGWGPDGPRGNAYGLRGMAPGQNRGFNNQAFNNWSNAPLWQSQQAWQQRQAGRGDRDWDRERRNSATYYNYNTPQATYYNYDPYATWAPQIYRVYDYNGYTPNYGYAYDPYGYSYNSYDPYGYGYNNPSYYADPRDTFVRTLISSFFVPDQYNYTTFYTPPYYDNPYYSYSDPGYYYSNTGYYPSYYDTGYYGNTGYYDPYYYSGVPMFASPFYGDNSLKSSLLNFGVQMLQGMLGQGYNQGLNDAEYVRVSQGPVYYDPYQAPEPSYYSPYVSSFADQRQIFENGYRMGYEDAMRNQDPYGVYNNSNARVDVVSQFLANSFLGS